MQCLISKRLLFILGLTAFGSICGIHAVSDRITTKRIEAFPQEPAGYELIDWRQRSSDYVRFALDPSKQGEYLPLMWWDDSQIEGRKTEREKGTGVISQFDPRPLFFISFSLRFGSRVERLI